MKCLSRAFIDGASELIAMTDPERQTMLCSATLSEEVQKLVNVLPVIVL